MINQNTTLQELFDRAVDTISEVSPGEVFIVKELFRGFEWNRIRKAYRTQLGSMFFAYAKGQGSSYIEPIDKTPQNQQKYRKL